MYSNTHVFIFTTNVINFCPAGVTLLQQASLFLNCNLACGSYRYDDENIGVIDGSKFMKKLGISLADKGSSTGRVDVPNIGGQPSSPTPPGKIPTVSSSNSS